MRGRNGGGAWRYPSMVWLAACTAAVVIGGCSSSVGPAAERSDPAGSTTSPVSSSPSTDSARPRQTIKQVDLGSLTYVVGSERRAVALVKGKNTDASGRITELKRTVYSDADGDGFPDAAVEVAVTDGNGYEALWFIVRWDTVSQQPVVVDDPFARTFRCGDVVDSVKSASRGFAVSEHRTEGDLSPCSAQPPDAITRTVGLRGGWLAQLSPNGGYGGICPHAIGTDGTHAPPAAPLRIAPESSAPRISDTAKGSWLLLPPEYSRYAGIKTYRLVGYSNKNTTETFYSACAWQPV